MSQSFGENIGKPERMISSKHEVGAWEEHLDCWGLYRSTKDTLQLDKKQEQHLITSKKVKQNWKCLISPVELKLIPSASGAWRVTVCTDSDLSASALRWCRSCLCWKLVRSQIAKYTDSEKERERERELQELLGGTLSFVACLGIKILLRHKGFGSFQLQP